MTELYRVKCRLNDFAEYSKEEFRRTNQDIGCFGFLVHFNRIFEKNLKGLVKYNWDGILIPDVYSGYWMGSRLFAKNAIELLEVFQWRINQDTSSFAIYRTGKVLISCLNKAAREEIERLEREIHNLSFN